MLRSNRAGDHFQKLITENSPTFLKKKSFAGVFKGSFFKIKVTRGVFGIPIDIEDKAHCRNS